MDKTFEEKKIAMWINMFDMYFMTNVARIHRQNSN